MDKRFYQGLIDPEGPEAPFEPTPDGEDIPGSHDRKTPIEDIGDHGADGSVGGLYRKQRTRVGRFNN